jgi:precorrin-2/cobalt-factor-2 C20-methyltransferase
LKIGKLYGIGVGPGDPELLTFKAKRILEKVEVLLVPKSKMEKRSLALSIISGVVDKDWQILELLLPMIKDKEELQKHWQQAAKQVFDVLQQGKDAAFITLGDPTIYSTFTYLMKYVQNLEPEVQVEIVPGISAVNSISAWIKQPLAEGEESLVIIPAINEKDEIEKAIDQFDNIVLLKAGSQTNKVLEILEDKDLLDKGFYVSRCGFKDGFYTSNLKEIFNKKFDYLSTMIIKKGLGDGKK